MDHSHKRQKTEEFFSLNPFDGQTNDERIPLLSGCTSTSDMLLYQENKGNDIKENEIKKEIDDGNVVTSGNHYQLHNFLNYPIKTESGKKNSKLSSTIDQQITTQGKLISKITSDNQHENNCRVSLIKEVPTNETNVVSDDTNNVMDKCHTTTTTTTTSVTKKFTTNFAGEQSNPPPALTNEYLEKVSFAINSSKHESSNIQTTTTAATNLLLNNNSNIKEMLNCLAPSIQETQNDTGNFAIKKDLNANSIDSFRRLPCLILPKLSVPIDDDLVADVSNLNSKHNLILQSYKKHDDKRRATHNEIERRRRDKINNWIFKLRELIPDDEGSVLPMKEEISNLTNSTQVNGDETKCGIRPTSTTNDSKSQILIKACNYIKAMQDEMESLRVCLRENESLRLSNRQLQIELEEMKNQRRNAMRICKLSVRDYVD